MISVLHFHMLLLSSWSGHCIYLLLLSSWSLHCISVFAPAPSFILFQCIVFSCSMSLSLAFLACILIFDPVPALWSCLMLNESVSYSLILSHALWLCLMLYESVSCSMSLYLALWVCILLSDPASCSMSLSLTLWVCLLLDESVSYSMNRSLALFITSSFKLFTTLLLNSGCWPSSTCHPRVQENTTPSSTSVLINKTNLSSLILQTLLISISGQIYFPIVGLVLKYRTIAMSLHICIWHSIWVGLLYLVKIYCECNYILDAGAHSGLYSGLIYSICTKVPSYFGAIL